MRISVVLPAKNEAEGLARTLPALRALFPQAQVIRVVLDNLNTHSFAALYATFPAVEARRIARKLEFHDTPKYASWLNMVKLS